MGSGHAELACGVERGPLSPLAPRGDVRTGPGACDCGWLAAQVSARVHRKTPGAGSEGTFGAHWQRYAVLRRQIGVGLGSAASLCGVLVGG
jgi:hypothetical protein